MFSLLPPIVKALDTVDDVLLLGAGGGYDIYGGYFLYRALKAMNKTVHLANYSFTDKLHKLQSPDNPVGPFVVPVTADTKSDEPYFPELYLAKHLKTTVYAFRQLPPPHFHDGLQTLIRHLNVKTVICIDNGTDALLYGTEGRQRGSPYEDMCTVVSVLNCLNDGLLEKAWLICVSAVTEEIPMDVFLKKVADQVKQGGYMGSFSMDNEHADQFESLLNTLPVEHRSIPCESLLASMHGEFDANHFVNDRLTGRIKAVEDFPAVTPLTTMVWAFCLPQVLSGSPLVQFLYDRWSKVKGGHSVTDDDSLIVQYTIAFNRDINVFFVMQDDVYEKS
jgi:hypothetical protein